MAPQRGARRPSSDASEKLGRNSGNEVFDDDDDVEERGKSGDTISAEPKEMPLKGAASSPSPENAGAQGSGEASPARRGGVAMKTKTTTAKRLKKPLPALSAVPEEDEAEDSGEASPVTPEEEEAEDSGDASPSPARSPLPEDSADAGHRMAATPRRGEKRSPPRRQEEAERPNKRAAGADAETVTVAVSAPQRKKKNKRSAEKDRRKKKKKKHLKKALTEPTSKKKKQLEKALTKPTSPPQFLESGLKLNANREDTPSSPDIAQEDEHRGREKAEQKLPPHDKDMHSAHGEEQQEDEVANQEHGDEEEQLEEGVPQQGQPIDTLPPQEKNRDLEDEETGAQVGKALQGRIAPSTKPRGPETEKKPAVERSWSYDDELKILDALVAHALSHNGALPDPSHLLANITFDKIDANEEKLADKIRKLKTRYRKFLSQGCRPSDSPARRLFKLSEIVWGQVAEDEWVEPISRDLSVLSNLYPHLAKEVKGYAEAHSSGNFIMAMFTTIGDEKARDLDAKCKKQQIEALKLELGQASLINELLSALSSLPRAKL